MYLYGGEQLNESDSEQEYFTYAEIYISNAAGATLRKVNQSPVIYDQGYSPITIKYKKQNESDSRTKGSLPQSLLYDAPDVPDITREIQLARSGGQRPLSIWSLATGYLQTDKRIDLGSMPAKYLR